MDKISLCGMWEFIPAADRGKVFTISVPGSWKHLPGSKEWGSGFFLRRFTLDERQLNKRLSLYFGGVFRRAEVRLNGMPVAVPF